MEATEAWTLGSSLDAAPQVRELSYEKARGLPVGGDQEGAIRTSKPGPTVAPCGAYVHLFSSIYVHPFSKAKLGVLAVQRGDHRAFPPCSFCSLTTCTVAEI